MKSILAWHKWNYFIIGLGALIAMVGLIVMVGWLIGSKTLVQIHAEFASMKFNTALSFLLTGIGIIFIKTANANAARYCGAIISLIATINLFQWIFGINLHIDNVVIVDQFYDPTAPPGRMSIPTTLCFLMSAIALILFSYKHKKAYLVAIVSVLGGIVLALGMIGLIDYALSIYSDYGWQEFTVMAVHTAASFSLVGLSFVLISVLGTGKYTLRFSAEIIPVATVLVTLCLSLSIALENKNTEHTRRILLAQLDNQIEQTRSDIDFVVNALARGVTRWEMHTVGISNNDWQPDAQLYLETLPYLQTLAWINPSKHRNWQAVKSGSPEIKNLNDILFQLRDVSRKGFSLQSMSTNSLGKILVITSPIHSANINDGFLLAVFDFSSLFNNLSQLDNHGNTWLNIKAGKDILFSSLDPSVLLRASFSTQRLVTIQNLEFEFEKGFLSESGIHRFGILSSSIFIVGTLFILIMLIAIFAYQRSRIVMKILNTEKERSRLVIEAAPGAMLLIDSEGNIEFSNTKAELLFGFRPGMLLGKNVDILVPDKVRAKHHNLRDSFMENPKFRSMAKGQELFGQHKNGQLIPLEIELCPIKSDQGPKVLASIFDLSERTKQIQELKRSKDELDRAAKIAKVGGWQMDIATETLSWSIQTYKIHEVPLTVSLTKDFSKNFYSTEDQVIFSQAIENAMQSGQEWDLELPLTTLMNNKIWVRNQGQVEYKDNKPVRIVGAIQDITLRREVMLELERSNQELNNFAYVASHDLKSPLRGIDQLATWLSEDLAESISSQTQEHLRLMRSRINRMENLLDDLLAYSRAGRTEVMTECVDIIDFVQQTFDFCNIEQGFNLQLIGDKSDYLLFKTPLELVLRNLINNAIKHHDKKLGNIVVSVKFKNNWLEFSVADDGPGIPAEHNERAFAMFQTLQPRDKVEGSGMGLAIVRKVVESFGGSIELSSNQPRGALFRFNFPAKINPR